MSKRALLCIIGWLGVVVAGGRVGLSQLLFAQSLPSSGEPLAASRPLPEKPPFYDEVLAIIEPLEYSALKTILNPELELRIDFDEKLWFLTNFNRYDEKGNISLEEGRLGLCSQLSAYTFRRIRPLFPPSFQIQFARVGEPQYFMDPGSSHYILVIDAPTGQTYIVDSTFHRYAPLDEFGDEYLFYERRPFLRLPPHALFQVDSGTPILIRNEHLIDLSVVRIAKDRPFSQKHFAIALSATPKFEYPRVKPLLLLQMRDGRPHILEDRYEGESLLGEESYGRLRRRMIFWFKKNAKGHADLARKHSSMAS